MRWRMKLAEVAGFPPLLMMDGYFNPDDWWCMPPGMGQMLKVDGRTETDLTFSHAIDQVFRSLPIPWDYFANDPLTTLLNHEDGQGRIASADCGPLADRLEGLLPRLPDGEGGGHIGDWRDKTRTFITGLRAAAAAGEDVEFH